jgi:hypothetical protein
MHVIENEMPYLIETILVGVMMAVKVIYIILSNLLMAFALEKMN